MTHRLVINILATAAGSSTSLVFEVPQDEAEQAISRLGDPDGVLDFRTDDGRGRRRSRTLIPVRAITHVGYDIEG